MKLFVLVLSVAFLSLSLSPVLYAEEKATASEEGPGQSVPTLGNQHIPSLRAPHAPYNSVPPTSGPHTHDVAQWGVYRQQIPDELQVHNLEDGGVMIQYDCSGCKDLMKQLESLVRSYYKKAKAEEKESGRRSPIKTSAIKSP